MRIGMRIGMRLRIGMSYDEYRNGSAGLPLESTKRKLKSCFACGRFPEETGSCGQRLM